MSLEQYRRKRDFHKTVEPHGERKRKPRGAKQPAFVVQKHAASHLHYDFRLELDGVLLSWAVPKGPSLDPKLKRLAMQTEDHPLEYGSFEGTIPQGEYGGGTVMVWDRGTWQAEGDARADYARGRLTFVLHGEKLKGRFHLVRTRRGDAQNAWLLFKGSDDDARASGDVVLERPDSVKSGRTLDEIAAGRRARRRVQRAPAKPEQSAHDAVSLRAPLTNPDKVLYPEQGLTKRDLALYYEAVAAWMLPHVAGRPLTLVRCPEGRHRHCFFQKHHSAGMPEAIAAIPVYDSEGDEPYMAISTREGLGALVQVGALEIHTWGAHADRAERPDLLVLDLDPDPELPFSAVVEGALLLRGLLGELGLESFVKTTGGKGLHVCFPVERRQSWDEAKAFCKKLADTLERHQPERYVSNMAKARRKGKIFVDYLRNGRGATFVAPYSTRARPDAPVALPLGWTELRADLDPRTFTVLTVPRRLRTLRSDPWSGMLELEQSITQAARGRLGL